MKWRHQDITQWHRHFAWLPVVVDDRKVWLETVEARQLAAHVFVDAWEYRAAQVDTRPQGGDAKQAPFTGSAVGETDAP